MRIETERKMKRWREQRWILDQVIQTRGIDWDQGRTGKIIRNCGSGVEKDLTDLCSRIKKFVDSPREFSQAAARREAQGRQAEAAGKLNGAREHYYIAACFYTNAMCDQLMRELEAAGHADRIRAVSGLPPASYFSAGKIRWILDHVEGVRDAAARGQAVFGTIDSWLLWNLTGGIHGGVHATDITNASRTMLMSLESLEWDEWLLETLDIPRAMLPAIHLSASEFGETSERGPFEGRVPIRAVLGDQQAAMVGQTCFRPGVAKDTYGTGNFMLMNTGREIVPSKAGLLTTVCYGFQGSPAVYALEGSVAVTGAAVQWLRDQLGLIGSAAEIEALAQRVPDTGGVYFMPAFSGLFAPYWRSDARGVIVGLTRYSDRGHLARATLATWQPSFTATR